VRGLIDALRASAPPIVMVVVDGPKPDDEADARAVQSTRDAVAGIDWDAEVRTRFRPVNVGLRRSVVDAVSWAVGEYGQVAVIEEDVVPGPDFLPYVEHMLERFRDDERIMHISGYNVVPADVVSSTAMNRLTAYPESTAWATWDRAWAHYDDDLTWLDQRRVREVTEITGSRFATMRWTLNLADARAGRISTWAYRWIASIWSRKALVVSPNVNLVTYVGYEGGTHTATRAAWTEQPLYDGPRSALFEDGPIVVDPRAEKWTNRVVFRGTPIGVARGIAISVVLALRKRRRDRRARRAAAGATQAVTPR
jgi:hypothetical protein